MAIGAVIGLAKSAGEWGTARKEKVEGAGSYDPYTGEFYDSAKVERNMVMGASFNPLGNFRDKNLTTGEKIVTALLPGTAGLFAKKYRKRLEAKRAAIAEDNAALRTSIEEDLPTYQASEYATEKLTAMEDANASLQNISSEVMGLASDRASKEEMDDTGMQRENIRGVASENIDSYLQSGSASAMSGILNTGVHQQAGYRDLNKKQVAYKMQGATDLRNAMQSSAGMRAAGAQLQASGLDSMINENDKVFQSELDKQLTLIDYDINLAAGNLSAEMQSNMNYSQANSAAMNGVSDLAMSYLKNKYSSSDKNKD